MGNSKRHILNILIGGEAGQGIVTVGNLLSKSLVRSGYSIVVTQDYQSRIRGGHNTFSIRAGAGEVIAPQEQIDLLVALDRDTVTFHHSYLSPEGLVVLDDSLGIDGDSFLKVPFKEISLKKFSNITALGVICSLIGLNKGLVGEVIGQALGGSEADSSKENSRIFIEATAWTEENASSSHRLATPVNNVNGQLMMNGNEAIALGAIAGGMRFAAFYPMTPATSIILNLVHHAKKLDFIVEQAEDEIAAINMAIGASFAGAPSMVATSGGGFALMTESISLAAMTETPVVVAVAQRPGPATGLPTRTEQADLEFVLHAGHGEFPRAIFTPGTVEECFYLTSKAFEMADKYQGPMLIYRHHTRDLRLQKAVFHPGFSPE
jgi:2-oxoglutarate ferredoxin oxidoreductase subunit alpha